MLRTRVLLPAAAVAAALATFALHAQSPDTPRLFIRANLGLPAIDVGVSNDLSHAPGTSETAQRDTLVKTIHTDGVGVSGVPYARGRVIVKFRDTATTAQRVAAVSSSSDTGSITIRPSSANFDLVTINANEDAEATADRLSQRPEVEYAQAAYRVHTMLVPNDPLYKSSPNFTPGQWNLPLIGMEQAWDIQPAAGSTITVAVLDTGLAYMNATITANLAGFTNNGVTYPALGNVTIPYAAATQIVTSGRIVAPYDFIWNGTQPPLDFDGHGTHVSGTIGQLTNDAIGTAGVAFNVKLMPVKVIDSPWDAIMGAPNAGTDDVVARGIRYAADNGAKVINMSIGRTGPPDTAPVVEDAIRYAVGKGVFVAIAAGNDYENGNPKEVLAEIASRVQGAVSVASVDRNATLGDGKCLGSSTSPSCHSHFSSTGTWVELSAPGGSDIGFGADGFVWQQTFDYRFVETYLLPPSGYKAPRFDMLSYIGYVGTSQATPHVSGVAAMLMQQGITNPAAIEAALEHFATDLGPAGRDNMYGYGLVNARASLFGMGIAR